MADGELAVRAGVVTASARPPVSRAVRPLLQPGDLLTSRYRLIEPVDAATPGETGPAVLWRAHDEVLDRPVAVKVMSAGGRKGGPASRRFLEAAATAGTLLSPVLARVYDAALEERPAQRYGRQQGEIDVAYVIGEWVDGPTLAESLTADGPWDPLDACALAAAIAEALGVAHARSIAHGRLHPGNVLLPRDGGVKVTDLAVAAALPEQVVPSARAGDPDPCAADMRDLAAVLYACLTARWPASATPQPSGGVPLAPAGKDGARRGKLISPRQVRAGVPRALDALVVRALDPVQAGELGTAAGFVDAIEAAVRADAPRVRAPRAPRTPRWVRRLLPFVIALLFLAAVSLIAYRVGERVGKLPPDDVSNAQPSPSPLSATRPGTPIGLTAVPVRDFDPPPGDGQENTGAVPAAHDGDPSTAWETERYQSDSFGGSKQGVGLLIDLGTPTAVRRAVLTTQTPGMVVELRAGDRDVENAAAYRVVARGQGNGSAITFDTRAGTSARYYLVWITGLPKAQGRYYGSVSELAFTRG